MAILDAGLTATLSREFARVDNQIEEKIQIFKTLETLYFILIGFSIFLVFALSDTLANHWLIIKTYNPSQVSYFIRIISFDIGFQLLLRFYLGGLLGLEEQIKGNIYQIGWGILRNGLVVLAIMFFSSLEIFFFWQTISTVVFALMLKLSLNKSLGIQYKFNITLKIEKSVFKRIWRFAGGMLLISIVASLNTQMDKLAISKLLPIEYLGYYTLAVSLSMSIIVLVNPISIALLPRFTALYSAGKKDEASILFQKINLFVAILVFSAFSIIAIFAKELIWVWTGKIELAERAHVYVPFIAMSAAMLSLTTIPYNIAIANGYTKLNNLLGLISLIITLPGYWIATKHYGAIGAASVFCIVQTVATLVYIYFINVKFLQGNKLDTLYIKQLLLPMLISLSIAYLFSFIPDSISTNRIFLLIWIGLASFTTLTFSILSLFPKSDIKKIFIR